MIISVDFFRAQSTKIAFPSESPTGVKKAPSSPRGGHVLISFLNMPLQGGWLLGRTFQK